MASSSAPADPTFRSYRSDQAKVYATHRQAYVPAIYETILKHHAATNGDLGLVVDCGCGPGHATRDLALAFDEAIGIDAGAAMIETAREMGGKTRSGKEIRFGLCPAEEFSRVGGLAAGSVDLVTVAMAAHWFEMDKFWVECAKVLKPGGTVAIWTRASAFVHPSTPNAAQCREMGRRFAEELAPYEAPASFLSRGMYDNLPLPWDLPTPVSAFPESSYVKHDYDRGGVLSNGETFFGGGKLSTLDDVERGLATASPVTRWREAHPSLVGTEKDVVRKLILGLRAALGDVKEVMQGRQHDIPGPSYVKHGPDHEKWVLIPMFPDEFSRGTFRRSEEDLVTCLLSPPRSPIRKAARTHTAIQPSKAHTVIDTSRVALNAMLTGKYASPQLGVRLHGGWRAPGSQSEGEPPTRRLPLLWDDDSQGGRRRGQVSSQYSSPLAPAAPRYRALSLCVDMIATGGQYRRCPCFRNNDVPHLGSSHGGEESRRHLRRLGTSSRPWRTSSSGREIAFTHPPDGDLPSPPSVPPSTLPISVARPSARHLCSRGVPVMEPGRRREMERIDPSIRTTYGLVGTDACTVVVSRLHTKEVGATRCCITTLSVTAPKHPAPSVQRQNHHPPAGRVSTGLLAARIFSPTAVAVCRAVRTCEDARRILTLVDGAATQRPHLPSPPQRDIVYIDTSIAGMLLPSAIGCDASQTTPQTRFQCALFASPISPPSSSSSSASASSSSHPAINNLYSTCRALQSMLTVPSQLPSPPTTHADAPSSSFKLRLRARKNVDSDSLTPRKKITKRAPAPPRGVNKRRRPIDDEMTRGDTEDPSSDEEPEPENRPSTPKRQRLAPEVLPLGLERSDFHTLHLQTRETEGGVAESVGGEGVNRGEDLWSTEEDRILVELVLEKLKLSKSDWQDCARSLGKDRGTVGRRWRSLMGGGEVGLKNRSRRGKLHSTWR